MLNNIKIISISLVSFLAPFLIFLFLFQSSLGNVQIHNTVAHSILIVAVCLICFYISIVAYYAYKISKDLRFFIITLAFCVFGFVFMLHGISIPDFFLGDKIIFEITEHYGLFLGSLICLGLVLPPQSFENKIDKNKLKIILGLLLFLLVLFALLIFYPNLAIFLEKNIEIPIIITLPIFLLVTIFLAKKYNETKNNFLLYLTAGF